MKDKNRMDLLNCKSLKKNKNKKNNLSKIAVLSRYTIWNEQTNLTSSYNRLLLLSCSLLCCFCFLFVCLALHCIMVTIADDHGTWTGLVCTIFACLLDICSLYIMLNILLIKIDWTTIWRTQIRYMKILTLRWWKWFIVAFLRVCGLPFFFFFVSEGGMVITSCNSGIDTD